MVDNVHEWVSDVNGKLDQTLLRINKTILEKVTKAS